MKRSDIISNDQIKKGDVIVGLSSYGKASYETEYNGGMGSNGLTSARHDVFHKYIAEKYPESYDPAVPYELLFSGNKKLTDSINIPSTTFNESLSINAGKLVLSPTRTYAPIIKKILDQYRSSIHGMVHCSGGAQTKILHFIDNLHIIKDNMMAVPPLFSLIQEESGTDWKEMYKVFNMGHRMEFYVPLEIADDIIRISKEFNVDAQIIGRVEDSKKKQVTIRSAYGEFNYV
jgi:phosphoribosylformylglycinamidine cyclo-ligase